MAVHFSISTNQLNWKPPNKPYWWHWPKQTRHCPWHPIQFFDHTATAYPDTLPPDTVPVDVSVEPNYLVIPYTVGTVLPADPPEPPLGLWIEYINQLPLWEKFLLQHTAILDKSLTLDLLRTHQHLYFTSDVGAIPTKAAFGCVLASNDTILVECGGQVEGSGPQSFQAKSYRLLAILWLIFHLCQYFNTRNSSLKFTGYTDSKSLLCWLKASLKLTQPIPCQILFSEADVEM